MARIGRSFPSHPVVRIPLVAIPSHKLVAAGSASVSVTAYNIPLPQTARPITAAVSVVAWQPGANAQATTASVIASALSPSNQVQAGLAAASVASYNPIFSIQADAGVAGASVAAFNTSASVQPGAGIAPVAATAYNAGLPPFLQMPIVSLQVAFNNNIFDPLSSMVWTDITQYMNKDATIKYGRQHALDGTSAATLEVTLNDRDGRFTPYNTGSPYYGNGQTTGLVPSKPVRMTAQYGGVNYPIYYGYVSSWSPVVTDQVNQDAKLTATDILGILGKTYLANTTIYPNLVLSAGPAAYFRLGDIATSTNETTSHSLIDYSNQGGSASVIVPNLPAASVAAMPTPFWVGGATGQFLYDINTQIALGNAGTASSAISTSQQNITSIQQTLTSDQLTLTNDQTQLAKDIVTANASLAAAELAAQTTLTDAQAAYNDTALVAYVVGGAINTSMAQLSENVYSVATSPNTINSANFTIEVVYLAGAEATQSENAAAAVLAAVQNIYNNRSNIATAVALSTAAVTTYGTAGNTGGGCSAAATLATGTADYLSSLSGAFQATFAQANLDGNTTAASSASFAVPYADNVTTDAQNAANCVQTVQSDLQNVQSAYNAAQSDASQVTQDQATVATDAATVALDQANLVAAQAAALITVADTTAYIRASASVAHPYGGVGWFTTTALPVSGYYNQTIATVSLPTGGTVGAIQVNSSGHVTFNYGGTAEITSASFTNASGNVTNLVNDGNVHMVAWILSTSGGTISLYLDGILQGTFSHSGLYPGIQTSGTPYIAIGGRPVSGVLQGDFAGTVQDWALFNTSNLTSTNIAALYVLGSKFQHAHTTTDRTQDCLDIALGQTAYNNVPQNIQGNSLCFPEPNQLIQTTALSYIAQVAATENGYFFQTPNGTVTQYPINYVQTNPTSTTSQGVYADNPTSSFHYLAQNFQFQQNNEDLYSTIQIMQSTGADPTTATGAPVQLATLGQFIAVTNNTAASVFGSSTLQQSGILLANQTDITFLANLLLARYQYPIPQVASLTLSSADTVNLPQMLGRGLWDRVTVDRGGPGEVPFTQDSVIEEITHSIDVTTPVWTTTYSLSPYELIFYGSSYGDAAASATVGAYNASVTTS